MKHTRLLVRQKFGAGWGLKRQLTLRFVACFACWAGVTLPFDMCNLLQTFSTPAAPHAVTGGDASSKKADGLLSSARGDATKMLQAYHSIKGMLDKDPHEVSLKLRAAEAAVSFMRITGHANSLACQLNRNKPEVQKQDTEANMAVWAEWAPIAQKLLGEVEETLGETFYNDASIYVLSVEANMYATSSRGIVTAVLSGKAVSFLASISKLEKLHPAHDNAIYCVYWGAYYLAAPWPASSASKARSYFERMVKAYPASRRNQYWAGVGAFMEQDFTAAQKYMERALEEQCASPSELDVCEWITAEAKRTLDMLTG